MNSAFSLYKLFSYLGLTLPLIFFCILAQFLAKSNDWYWGRVAFFAGVILEVLILLGVYRGTIVYSVNISFLAIASAISFAIALFSYFRCSHLVKKGKEQNKK